MVPVHKIKTVKMLYGTEGMELRVPVDAMVLEGQAPPAIPDPHQAVREALACPIGSPPLADLIAKRKPATVAITISDITRPVPNKLFLPAMLEALNAAGVADRQIVIIIGTGMHRPSTTQEREIMLGRELLSRLEVIDHTADKPDSLVRISDRPPVSVCRRFAKAGFRIVTGYIEPHFMAGFSGGRKGVCPALVDLATVQRFHGYGTLADPRADNGILEGNPCHEIALKVAQAVGVDFLFNVAITRDRRIAGIYCGGLVEAHLAGCEDVAAWTTAVIDKPFDLVVTNGGGFPLDQTFYQTVKGMCTALPALGKKSTLLVVSHCGQQLGSACYSKLMLKWANRWRKFLAEIAASRRTKLDQWELQMQARVLARIGKASLWFASDGIPPEMQQRIAVRPLPGPGNAAARAQRAIDQFLAARPTACVAVIPDGPYTMLQQAKDKL
jgi:nickel-dependent lactate racemase